MNVVNSVLVSCGPINLDNYPSGKKENHRLKRAKRLVPRKGTSWTWNEIMDLPSLFHQDLDSLQ